MTSYTAPRSYHYDDILKRNGISEMDPVLASSWPQPTPSKFRPEPPRAPLRRFSEALIDVPPLELPAGQKRSLSGGFSGATPSDVPPDEEDEEEEEGIFSLGEGADEDDGESTLR